MQSFKIVACLLLGYFWLNLKFTPKYTMVGGHGGVLKFVLRSIPFLLVTMEPTQSFKIVAYLLLGYFWLADPGGYIPDPGGYIPDPGGYIPDPGGHIPDPDVCI